MDSGPVRGTCRCCPYCFPTVPLGAPPVYRGLVAQRMAEAEGGGGLTNGPLGVKADELSGAA